jgi:hypothetical protein
MDRRRRPGRGRGRRARGRGRRGDTDQELTGTTRDRAAAAALAATGGGTVLETEAGDDGAAYGVEVRLPDGRQVEVTLDQRFKVLGREPDEDQPGETDGR